MTLARTPTEEAEWEELGATLEALDGIEGVPVIPQRGETGVEAIRRTFREIEAAAAKAVSS